MTTYQAFGGVPELFNYFSGSLPRKGKVEGR